MTIHDCPECHMKQGSDTAREQGCSCPTMDNGRGHSPRLITTQGCPIHWPDKAD